MNTTETLRLKELRRNLATYVVELPLALPLEPALRPVLHWDEAWLFGV